MKYRQFGNTGFMASEISLGTWQLGGKWGEMFSEQNAKETLNAAYNNGINLFDTADCYRDGLSEKAIGEFIKDKKEKIFVVTKCGRRLNPHIASGYNNTNIRAFVDDSIHNMGLDCLDMVLLHCPPSEVYDSNIAFDTLDALKKEKKIRFYGVSIEKVEDGIKALEHDISAIEVIFNMFRLKPARKMFALAKAKNVAIIVRVPLASGLLTGKFNENTVFDSGDHRNFNREGQAFDKGETFSGVSYQKGLLAVNELKKYFKTDDLAKIALKFILMYSEVATIIPGASSKAQIEENVKASEMKALNPEDMKFVFDIYDKYVKVDVENNW